MTREEDLQKAVDLILEHTDMHIKRSGVDEEFNTPLREQLGGFVSSLLVLRGMMGMPQAISEGIAFATGWRAAEGFYDIKEPQ